MDICVCCEASPEKAPEEREPLPAAPAFRPAAQNAPFARSSESRIRVSGSIRPWVLVGVLTTTLILTVAGVAAADFDPETVFTTRCGACHTVGDGDDVGPDLAGVTQRRSRDWLIPFIRSSQTVILSGDEIAGELFERFGRTKMPDHPYAAEEIEQLLAFIEAGGPADRVARVRPADDASSEEIGRGALLFFGHERLENGGAACADCHSVTGDRQTRSLGGDLRDVYSRYQDREITRSLIQMSHPLMDEAYRDRPLSDEENYALKAFLAQVAGGRLPETGALRAQRGAWIPWIGLSVAMLVSVLGDGSRRLRRLLRLRRRRDRRGRHLSSNGTLS